MRIRWRLASPGLLLSWPGYLLSLGYSAWHLLFHRRRKSPPIEQPGFDLVTVVFKAELSLIKRQAQSLALHLDPGFAGDIILIVNDLDQWRLMRALRNDVLPAYGIWRDRVRLVPFYMIGLRLDPANGWIIQQALKLLIAHVIHRPVYVLLDAKNHFFRPVTSEHFVTPDGAAIQPLREDTTSLPDHWATCLRYFGHDAEAPPLASCRPVTPFVMHTQTVRDLVGLMERRESRSLCTIFAETRLLSEFLLYRIYLHDRQRQGSAPRYIDGPPLSITLWGDHATVDATIFLAEADASKLCFGVHRELLKRLDPGARAALTSFWERHGLPALDGPVAPYRWTARRQAFRALPPQVKTEAHGEDNQPCQPASARSERKLSPKWN